MALEVLVRQAKASVVRSGRSLDEAIEEVLDTRAGEKLSELATGPHRNEKAAVWQAALLKDRVERRQ